MMISPFQTQRPPTVPEVVPGQADNPRFTAGTVPVNTEIQVPVSILDQAMGTATLTVTYKTPDMNAGQNHSVTLVQAGSTIHTYISAQNPAPVYNYTYTAGFNFPIAGSSAGSFKPQNAGTYTFNLEATDAAGNRISRSMTVRAIQPGTSPDGVDGPPQVDEIVPADGAKEIMVTMPVMVTFNEPVENVTGETLKLFSLDYDSNTQQTYENPVAATVYTSLEGGRVRATLQPRTNLTFGKNYKIVVSTEITDAVPNSEAVCGAQTPPQPDGCLLPLIRQYTAVFTTKIPQIYDLDEGQFTSGRGIDLYTDPADGKTYAYVAADAEGWYVMDVTDPTAPAVVTTHKMTSAGVTWMNRGVDVDQENSLLALTEDIRYVSGNQYGYIRFYDLTNNAQGTPPTTPADPKLIGREKLAEAYSGVPMRLSLMNNFAYIATVNVGLQVVDIEAAKTVLASGQQADGSSIVGIFDTWDKGYRNPTDIVAYKGGRAALTTTSGHLVLLDINLPQFPQEMKAFKPTPDANNHNYDSAWRVAVASEYAYTPLPIAGEGGGEGTQVIDLAVTGSMAGRIHTVDITDPYNPVVLGVTKDGIGNEVIASVTDITISKASGLVYATAGMSVYIIDIKDPYNPVLLNIVTQTPTEPGSTTMTALGGSNALVEKDGWVYLANQNQGMRVLDLDPKEMGIQADDEFDSVRIPETDYYAALGTKGVTIYGVISGVPLGNEWGLYLSQMSANMQVGGSVDATGNIIPLTNATLINRFTANSSQNKGFAKLYMKWNGTTASMPENFSITLQARKIGATTLNAATSTKIYDFAFRNRHNGNVTMGEVLKGDAVFVADGIISTSTGTSPDKQGFDAVKELLNQVIPRSRTMWAATASYPTGTWLQNTYKLIEEEGGIYDAKTEIAIRQFRDSFTMAVDSRWRIGNTNANFTIDQNNNANYKDSDPDVTINGPNDNTTDTFRKLMKDYNHRATPADSTHWLNKIIDKETLVGKEQRIPDTAVTVTTANADVEMNRPTNRHDTGIYEFYKNVVERFIDRTIKEAERYAGLRTDVGDPPMPDWKSRSTANNPSIGPLEDPQYQVSGRRGMSYSYGGRQSIEDFNKEVGNTGNVTALKRGVVANCNASVSVGKDLFMIGNKGIGWANCQSCHLTPAFPPNTKVSKKELVYSTTVDGNYQGNVSHNVCTVGGGYQKYPGLKKTEFDSNGVVSSGSYTYTLVNFFTGQAFGSTVVYPQFNGDYWAGTDCSNFVGKSVEMAKNNVPWVNVAISSALYSGEYCSIDQSSASEADKLVNTYPIAAGKDEATDEDIAKFLRRGDVISYKGHVSLVYSNKWGESSWEKGGPSRKDIKAFKYDIIHSYGGQSFRFNDDDPVFSRKVLVTGDNLGVKTPPNGIGRIRLWN